MCNHACVLSPGHLGQTWAQVRMRENSAMAAKDLIRGLNRRQDRLEWLQETTVFWKGPQNTVKNADGHAVISWFPMATSASSFIQRAFQFF